MIRKYIQCKSSYIPVNITEDKEIQNNRYRIKKKYERKIREYDKEYQRQNGKNKGDYACCTVM